MILRLLIGLGVVLMLAGFGAAGWQYWQSLPATAAPAVVAVEAETAPAKVETQRWLISPSGGLVPQEDVRAFLVQDRFVPKRALGVTLRASLNDLLAEGEKLPESEYLQVLADIRAPQVAGGLCDVLRQSLASDCAVNAARVVEGSVDPVSGTALFQLDLVYRLAADVAEMPDLAAHVLQSETVLVELEPGTEGSESAEAAVLAAAAAAEAACSGEDSRLVCRPMQFRVTWEPGLAVQLWAEIGWLAPLPEGMFVAPPL